MRLVVSLPLLLSLAFGACAKRTVSEQAAGSTLCRAEERVQFSCRVGTKLVSLCAQGPGGATRYLAYRFGRPRAVELAHVATRPGADGGFKATTMPLKPGAQVQQVWFERGTTRYLLAVCVGGNCPSEAAFAVIRDRKLIARWDCRPDGPPQRTSFAPELVDWGSDASQSRSSTPLLVVEEVDNPIELVFPQGAR